MDTTSRKIIFYLLIIAACVSVLQGLNNALLKDTGGRDMQWAPARILLDGGDPYQIYLDNPGAPPYRLTQAPNYPASGLVLFWAWAIWNWPAALTLWTFSNLLFTAGVLWFLYRLLPSDVPRLLLFTGAALFLAGTPWRNTIGNGQHGLFVLFFFLGAVLLHRRDRRIAGISLGISWFKYSITFPLSLHFLRDRGGWQAVGWAAALNAVLTLFASWWTGVSPVELLRGPLQVAQVSTGNAYLDVFELASRLGISGMVVPGVASLLILAITFRIVHRDPDLVSALSTLALASMTVVFHAGYDFIVLVIPLAYALREKGRTTRAKYYLLVIGIIWFSDRLVYESRQWLSPDLLFYSLYYWLKVAVYYGALAADWYHGLRRKTGG